MVLAYACEVKISRDNTKERKMFCKIQLIKFDNHFVKNKIVQLSILHSAVFNELILIPVTIRVAEYCTSSTVLDSRTNTTLVYSKTWRIK